MENSSRKWWTGLAGSPRPERVVVHLPPLPDRPSGLCFKELHPWSEATVRWSTMPSRSTGGQWVCRACESGRVSAWNAANQERRRAIKKAYRERHPDRERARHLAHAAIRRGELVRPERCEDCGRFCRPEAAHHDYQQPLDVRWLCHPCHMAADALTGSFRSTRRSA